MKKLLSFSIIALAISLLSGCGPYRQHPDFKTRQASIQTIAVMPPDFEVYRLSFKGDKDLLPEVTASANHALMDEVEQQLKNRGYTITPLPMDEETLAANPDLRTAWHTTKEMFEKTLTDTMKNNKPKFIYSLGPEINILADHAKADTLVFIKGSGAKKTGGEIAREFVLSIFGGRMLPSETLFLIGIVDGNTGDVLWLNPNPNIDLDAEQSIAMRQAVKDALLQFPKSSQKKK